MPEHGQDLTAQVDFCDVILLSGKILLNWGKTSLKGRVLRIQKLWYGEATLASRAPKFVPRKLVSPLPVSQITVLALWS